MIKHSLRIGNKVKVFGKIYTIKELGEFEAAMEETEGVFSYKDVQGVELTPSILQACGFEKKINETQIDGMEMTLEIDDSSTWFSSCGGLNGSIAVLCLCRGNYFANNIGHLHMLQNLYYFVTGGTELTINLEQVTP